MVTNKYFRKHHLQESSVIYYGEKSNFELKIKKYNLPI